MSEQGEELHSAVEKGNISEVRRLVTTKADVNWQDVGPQNHLGFFFSCVFSDFTQN